MIDHTIVFSNIQQFQFRSVLHGRATAMVTYIVGNGHTWHTN